MSIKFAKAASTPSKSPTFADVQDGQAFQTDYGTVYLKIDSNTVVKLGNPQKSDRNFVAVREGYMSPSRPVTPLGDLTISF